jgi:hypothetical protein
MQDCRHVSRAVAQLLAQQHDGEVLRWMMMMIRYAEGRSLVRAEFGVWCVAGYGVPCVATALTVYDLHHQ